MQLNETTGIRALYTEHAILEAAAQIVARHELEGVEAVEDFEKRVANVVQGLTLPPHEGGRTTPADVAAQSHKTKGECLADPF